MEFELRHYQLQCLEALSKYLRKVRELGVVDTAFNQQTPRTYLQAEGLAGLPYVCIRVPTGGGKTVMAAHAVGIAAQLGVCVSTVHNDIKRLRKKGLFPRPDKPWKPQRPNPGARAARPHLAPV